MAEPCIGIIQPPYTIMEVDVVWDADWRDPLPTIVEAESVPMNLTGKELQMTIRPSYDFDGEFIMISNVAVGGLGPYIVIDNAAAGLASIVMPRSAVQSYLPVSKGRFAWTHTFVLKDGTTYWELARGPFRVHPGLTSAITP